MRRGSGLAGRTLGTRCPPRAANDQTPPGPRLFSWSVRIIRKRAVLLGYVDAPDNQAAEAAAAEQFELTDPPGARSWTRARWGWLRERRACEARGQRSALTNQDRQSYHLLKRALGHDHVLSVAGFSVTGIICRLKIVDRPASALNVETAELLKLPTKRGK